MAERELGVAGIVSTEVAKPQVFDKTPSKVLGFLMACRLYQNKNEGNSGRRTNPVDPLICTGRISRCLEGKYTREHRSRTIGIQDSGGVFGGYQKRIWRRRWRINKNSRVEEIRIERENDRGRAARESGYEGRPLVEEFKRGISRAIRRKFMEAERPLTSIEQWYEYATNLDRLLWQPLD